MNDILLPRVQILMILINETVSAPELVERVHLPQEEISTHLKSLTTLDVLEAKKEGENVIYTIKDNKREQVSKFLEQYR